jgi:3-ketosteroid 9alpha-monooxygenase subunit B
MTAVDDVLRRHSYHPIRVKRVVEETDDARSLVLDVPDELAEVFHYQPGQFCTFRVRVGTDEHFRCYSMSSAPETDDDLAVTVKRVDGGVVSNWLNDNVSVGDLVEASRPSGTFRIRDGDRPIIGFCGGSGITPVISIAKSVLAASGRSVRLMYASRNPDSVIFDGTLRDLEIRHPGRLTVIRHFDSVSGFPDAQAVVDVAGGDPDADFYVCGPAPFMELVEHALLDLGAEPGAILIERFVAGTGPEVSSPSEPPGATVPSTIVLQLKGKRHEISYHPGDTVLETARRANLPAPYSCEAGSCATCMALVLDGSVTMRVNNALTPDEVAEGWILTCQSLPVGPSLHVDYEDA